MGSRDNYKSLRLSFSKITPWDLCCLPAIYSKITTTVRQFENPVIGSGSQ